MSTLLSHNISVFQPSDFLTIGLLVGLEGVLSADNAMVLALLVLGLPKNEQQKALRYGIVGAFLFRGAATLAAAYLIKLGWVKLAGAAYLLYLSYRALLPIRTPKPAARRRGAAVARPQRVLGAPSSRSSSPTSCSPSTRFWSPSPCRPKLWVILTGGMLGIVAMRFVIGRLLTLIERYPQLVDGAFAIIAWVGFKLLLEFLHKRAVHPLRDPRMDLADRHRHDLRVVVSLRPPAGTARGGSGGRKEEAARKLWDQESR